MVSRIIGIFLVLASGGAVCAGLALHFNPAWSSQAWAIYVGGILLLPIGLAFWTHLRGESSRTVAGFAAHVLLTLITLAGLGAGARARADIRILTLLAVTAGGQVTVGLLLLTASLLTRRRKGITLAASAFVFCILLVGTIYLVIEGL